VERLLKVALERCLPGMMVLFSIGVPQNARRITTLGENQSRENGLESKND